MLQVLLQWKDEEGDWIDFDTEGELCAAVQSLAARGCKLARVNAIIHRNLDSMMNSVKFNTTLTDRDESGVGWVLIEPSDTESPTCPVDNHDPSLELPTPSEQDGNGHSIDPDNPE